MPSKKLEGEEDSEGSITIEAIDNEAAATSARPKLVPSPADESAVKKPFDVGYHPEIRPAPAEIPRLQGWKETCQGCRSSTNTHECDP